MPRNNETKLSGVDEYFHRTSELGLRSYFGRVRTGFNKEIRSNFAGGGSTSLESVLNAWKTTLDTLSDEWPTLVDFENDLRAKVGPLSIMKPLSERLQDIRNYYEDILLPSSPISEQAIKATIAEFAPIRGIRVRNQEHTVEKMKKSTNSGSPYFTKRRNVVDKTIPCWIEGDTIYPTQELMIYTEHERLWDATAVLGWRGQEGGPDADDVKQRVVWMFPFAVNIAELQVYQPMIEAFQKHNLVPAWVSMESVDRCITQMFDTKGVGDLVICTDFSRFDQHFNQHMQEGALSILQAIMTKCVEAQNWFNYVFPTKYNIPLMVDYGEVRYGKHGMGSGSGGTNADETLAHRALQYEAAIKNNAKLNPFSQCLGDDGVLTYPGISVEQVIETYTAHGQEMNASKQYVSEDDCVYLRRWHHTNYRVDGTCVGVYSTYRALGRLMERERYYHEIEWNEEMDALRELSIIENVKYHPLAAKFAEFCIKRSKTRLGLDIPGFLDRIDKAAREAIDVMPDFLGYTRALGDDVKPSKWWIVTFLKNMR